MEERKRERKDEKDRGEEKWKIGKKNEETTKSFDFSKNFFFSSFTEEETIFITDETAIFETISVCMKGNGEPH